MSPTTRLGLLHFGQSGLDLGQTSLQMGIPARESVGIHKDK